LVAKAHISLTKPISRSLSPYRNTKTSAAATRRISCEHPDQAHSLSLSANPRDPWMSEPILQPTKHTAKQTCFAREYSYSVPTYCKDIYLYVSTQTQRFVTQELAPFDSIAPIKCQQLNFLQAT
jgi:hypothetical protein